MWDEKEEDKRLQERVSTGEGTTRIGGRQII